MRTFNPTRFHRFTLIYFGSVAGVLLLLSLVILFGDFVFPQQSDNTVILDYQTQKLAHGEDRDTVFIGDSSLGNGIEVQAWDKETGHRSVSLALTGLYGLPGSYNMAKRALRLPQIKRMIFVQSPDIMSRDFSVVGFCKTLSLDAFELRADPLKMLFECFVSLNRTIDIAKGLVKSTVTGRSLFIESDYLAQGLDQYSNGKRKVNPAMTWVPHAKQRSQDYLKKIDALCESVRPVECFYFRGPILSPLYQKNSSDWDAFYASLFKDLRHLKYVPGQVSFDESKMGDSEAHVAPSHKRESTRDYASLFQAFVANGSGANL